MVGQGEQPVKKTAEEIAREAEEENRKSGPVSQRG
jgi:hypothetical protein